MFFFIHFAEATENTWNGSIGFGKRIVASIARVADLLGQTWLEITLERGATDKPSFFAAEQLIKRVALEIGVSY